MSIPGEKKPKSARLKDILSQADDRRPAKDRLTSIVSAAEDRRATTFEGATEADKRAEMLLQEEERIRRDPQLTELRREVGNLESSLESNQDVQFYIERVNAFETMVDSLPAAEKARRRMELYEEQQRLLAEPTTTPSIDKGLKELSRYHKLRQTPEYQYIEKVREGQFDEAMQTPIAFARLRRKQGPEALDTQLKKVEAKERELTETGQISLKLDYLPTDYTPILRESDDEDGLEADRIREAKRAIERAKLGTTVTATLQDRAKNPQELLPFISSLSRIQRNVSLALAYSKRNRGLPVTEGEQLLMESHDLANAYTQANEVKGRPTGEKVDRFIGQVVGGILDSVPWMAEMVMTAGVHAAAKKSVLALTEGLASSTAGSAARKIGAATVATLAQSSVNIPGIGSKVAEKYLEGEPITPKLVGEAWLLNAAAYVSERSGDPLDLAAGKVKGWVLAKWSGKKPKDMAKLAVKDGIAGKIPFSSFLSEVAEEEINEGLDALIEGRPYTIPGFDTKATERLAVEAGSIFIMQVGLKGKLPKLPKRSPKATPPPQPSTSTAQPTDQPPLPATPSPTNVKFEGQKAKPLPTSESLKSALGKIAAPEPKAAAPVEPAAAPTQVPEDAELRAQAKKAKVEVLSVQESRYQVRDQKTGDTYFIEKGSDFAQQVAENREEAEHRKTLEGLPPELLESDKVEMPKLDVTSTAKLKDYLAASDDAVQSLWDKSEEVQNLIAGIKEQQEGLDRKSAEYKALNKKIKALTALAAKHESAVYQARIADSEVTSAAVLAEAKKRGVAFADEYDRDEFLTEALMQLSSERPYVETNFERPINEIFDDVIEQWNQQKADEEAHRSEKGSPLKTGEQPDDVGRYSDDLKGVKKTEFKVKGLTADIRVAQLESGRWVSALQFWGFDNGPIRGEHQSLLAQRTYATEQEAREDRLKRLRDVAQDILQNKEYPDQHDRARALLEWTNEQLGEAAQGEAEEPLADQGALLDNVRKALADDVDNISSGEEIRVDVESIKVESTHGQYAVISAEQLIGKPTSAKKKRRERMYRVIEQDAPDIRYNWTTTLKQAQDLAESLDRSESPDAIPEIPPELVGKVEYEGAFTKAGKVTQHGFKVIAEDEKKAYHKASFSVLPGETVKEKYDKILAPYFRAEKEEGQAAEARQAPEGRTQEQSPLDAFEASGKKPYQVTRAEWVEIMRGHMRSIGQSEDSNPNAPNVEYEEFHRSEVERAVREGVAVPKNVLKDYFMGKEGAAPAKPKEPWEMTKKEFFSSYHQHIDIRAKDVTDADANTKSIQRVGFKAGYANVIPVWEGRAGNVIQMRYSPTVGKTIYLVPNSSVVTGRGPSSPPAKIRAGWKPRASEVVRLEYEGQSLHEAVIKKALSEGKPVPPEVLKDYPDLKPKESTGKKSEKTVVLPSGIILKRIDEGEGVTSDLLTLPSGDFIMRTQYPDDREDAYTFSSRPGDLYERGILKKMPDGTFEADLQKAGAFFKEQIAQLEKASDLPTSDKVLGKNADGETVYEDKNGVRYRKKGNVRISAPVRIVPTREGVESQVGEIPDEFKVEAERGSQSGEGFDPTKATVAQKLTLALNATLGVGEFKVGEVYRQRIDAGSRAFHQPVVISRIADNGDLEGFTVGEGEEVGKMLGGRKWLNSWLEAKGRSRGYDRRTLETPNFTIERWREFVETLFADEVEKLRKSGIVAASQPTTPQRSLAGPTGEVEITPEGKRQYEKWKRTASGIQVEVEYFGERHMVDLLTRYKEHEIVLLPDGEIATWDKENGVLFRVALDDSKESGDRFVEWQANTPYRAKAYVDWKTQTNKQEEERRAKPLGLAIGDKITLGPKSVPSRLSRVETVDTIRYELFTPEYGARPQTATIRVVDEEAEKVVSIQFHPTIQLADEAFDTLVQKARQIATVQADRAPDQRTPNEVERDNIVQSLEQLRDQYSGITSQGLINQLNVSIDTYSVPEIDDYSLEQFKREAELLTEQITSSGLEVKALPAATSRALPEELQKRIEDKEFSFVQVYMWEGGTRSYIVFDPMASTAKPLVREFLKENLEGWNKFSVYPRTYVTDARKMLFQNPNWPSFIIPNPSDPSLQVLLDEAKPQQEARVKEEVEQNKKLVQEARRKPKKGDYPIAVDQQGHEHVIRGWGISLRTGWEWFGFQKAGDVWDGFVHGFEDEFGSFSEEELNENGVKFVTDPKELRQIAPPVGWTWKQNYAAQEEAQDERTTEVSGGEPSPASVLGSGAPMAEGEPAASAPRAVEEGRAARLPRGEGDGGSQSAAGAEEGGTESGPGGGSGAGAAGGEASGSRVRADVGAGVRPDRGVESAADRNHRIAPEDVLIPGGDITKIRTNIRAIQLLKELEGANRNPSPEEKKTLAQYVGWGGLPQVFDEHRAEQATAEWSRRYMNEDELKRADAWAKKYLAHYKVLNDLLTPDEYEAAKASTVNAHYTSREIISGMWSIVEQLGFRGGVVLEPAAGVGHFIGLMPESIANASQVVGVELDSISGRIFSKLYPQATSFVKGFEDVDLPANSVDLVISNVPFAKDGPLDDSLPQFSLHNYFLAKSLRLTKPGGLVVAITSSSTMDNPASLKARLWMDKVADLVGAIRLPNNAFKENAGTEVTTDILILRRKSGTSFAARKPWTSTQPLESSDVQAVTAIEDAAISAPLDVNEYYVAHPEMMLGQMALEGTMYGPNQPALIAPKDQNLSEELMKAAAHLPNKIIGATTSGKLDLSIISRDIKPNQLTEVDGKLGSVTVEKGKGRKFIEAPWAKSPEKVKIAKGYIEVREALKHLIGLELTEDSDDKAIEKARGELRKKYNDFKAKHNLTNGINSRALEFIADTDRAEFNLTAALEQRVDELQGEKIVTKYIPSDILTKRVNFPMSEPDTAESLEDAIQISLSYRGAIVPEYVGQMLEISTEEARSRMLKMTAVFENPETGNLEPPDRYLSGMVRKKLKAAEKAAEKNERYRVNVEALRAVLPEAIAFKDITIKVGANWIPPGIYENFIASTFGVDGTVSFIKLLGKWNLQLGFGNNEQNRTTWGTPKMMGTSIFEHLLNGRTIVVSDKDSEGRNVFNPEQTQAAQEMAKKIEQEFQTYIRSKLDPEVQKGLEETYNEFANGFVEWIPREPSWKHYPGASHEITLNPHQKRAVTRNLEESTLDWHEVGTGKTYIALTTAMEARRLKVAKKPMVAIQISTMSQFRESAKKLYPNARILVARKEDLERKNRQKLVSLIATNDWDAVVVPHTWLEMLPDRPDRILAAVKAELADLEMAQARAKEERDRTSVKELEKIKKRIIQRLKKAYLKRKTDQQLFFEQLGVDFLIVDEAHRYKRLGFTTSKRSVKGIDVAGSSRARSMLLKTQWVREHNAGRGVVFMTGTPVSNTMAEAWTLAKYLKPEVLDDYRINTFDEFANLFGRTTTNFELQPTGTFKAIDRLAQFDNLPEFVKMFHSFTDVVFLKDLDLKNVPTLKGGQYEKIMAEKSPKVAGFVRTLATIMAWWETAGKEKREQSHIPVQIYQLAKRATIDMRLVMPDAGDDPGSKANRAVKEIVKLYKRGEEAKLTQLVFSDDINGPSKLGSDFNLFRDMKRKMVALGVPEKQVAIIHDFDTEEKRTVLFARVREGSVRILMGSTERLGVGVNVQDRLYALHMIDVPRRPMDFMQRIGRIIRQGNSNKEVSILLYGMLETLDAAGFDLVATKAGFIQQLAKGEISARSSEDIEEEVAPDYKEIAAFLAGNPVVLDAYKANLRNQELEYTYSAWQRKIGESNYKLGQLTRTKIPQAEEAVDAYTISQAGISDAFPTKKVTSVKIGGMLLQGEGLYGQVTEAVAKILAEEKARTEQRIKAREYDNPVRPVSGVEVNGYPVALRVVTKVVVSAENFEHHVSTKEPHEIEWVIRSKDPRYASVNLLSGVAHSGSGLIASIQSSVENLPEYLRSAKAELAGYQNDLKTVEQFVKKPFEQMDELVKSRDERKRTQEALAQVQSSVSDEEKQSGRDAAERLGLIREVKEGAALDESDSVSLKEIEEDAARFSDAAPSKEEEDGEDEDGPPEPITFGMQLLPIYQIGQHLLRYFRHGTTQMPAEGVAFGDSKGLEFLKTSKAEGSYFLKMLAIPMWVAEKYPGFGNVWHRGKIVSEGLWNKLNRIGMREYLGNVRSVHEENLNKWEDADKLTDAQWARIIEAAKTLNETDPVETNVGDQVLRRTFGMDDATIKVWKQMRSANERAFDAWMQRDRYLITQGYYRAKPGELRRYVKKSKLLAKGIPPDVVEIITDFLRNTPAKEMSKYQVRTLWEFPEIREIVADALIKQKYVEKNLANYFTMARDPSNQYAVAAERPIEDVDTTDMDEDEAEDASYERFFNTYATPGEANEAVNRLAAQGYLPMRNDSGDRPEALRFYNLKTESERLLSGRLVTRLNDQTLYQLAESAGVAGNNPVVQRLVKELNTRGFKKYLFMRQRVPGFDWTKENIMRGVVNHYESAFRGYAKTVAVREAQKKFSEIKDQMPDQMIAYMTEYLDGYTMSAPNEYEVIRQAIYVTTMGLSVSNMLQNLTQPFFTTWPEIAILLKNAKVKTPAETERIFSDGYRYAMAYAGEKLGRKLGKNAKYLKPDWREHFERARREGELSPLQIEQLAGLEEDPRVRFDTLTKRSWRSFTSIMALLNRGSEVLNRDHAFAVGLIVGEKHYKLKGNDLYEFAVAVVNRTQYKYGHHNMPQIATAMRGNWVANKFRWLVSLALVLRGFSLNTLSRFAYVFRSGSAGANVRNLIALTMLVGLRGIPLAGLVYGLLNALLWLYGDDEPMEVKERKVFEQVEQDLGLPRRTLTTGIASAAAGVETSRLLGLGDVVPVEQPANLVGIPYALGKRAVGSLERLASGDLLGAVEQSPVTPRVLSTILRAERIGSEGVWSGSNLMLRPEELTQKDRALLRLGMTPTSVTSAYEQARADVSIGRKKAAVQRELTQRLAKARVRQDREEISRVITEIEEWNKSHPEIENFINPRTVVETALKGSEQVPKRDRELIRREENRQTYGPKE